MSLPAAVFELHAYAHGAVEVTSYIYEGGYVTVIGPTGTAQFPAEIDSLIGRAFADWSPFAGWKRAV